MARAISEKLNNLKILYKLKLIFYYLNKSFLSEGYNFYLSSNIKKINLLKQSLIE